MHIHLVSFTLPTTGPNFAAREVERRLKATGATITTGKDIPSDWKPDLNKRKLLLNGIEDDYEPAFLKLQARQFVKGKFVNPHDKKLHLLFLTPRYQGLVNQAGAEVLKIACAYEADASAIVSPEDLDMLTSMFKPPVCSIPLPLYTSVTSFIGSYFRRMAS